MLSLSPLATTILGTTFTFLMTVLGAALIFFIRHQSNKRLVQSSLGFAAGIMIAASIWSLLIPAMEHAQNLGMNKLLPALGGFSLGALFLFAIDKCMPHIHPLSRHHDGPQLQLGDNLLLFIAITIHNIPEGMAVGVACAASLNTGNPELISSVLVLALGIGIQNIPEGTAVALPFFASGMKKRKAFLLGALSGLVEPVAAIATVMLIGSMNNLLPWALSFAAGAMLYVVTEELIPQAHEDESHSDLATMSVLVGFMLMMALDIALG